MELSISTAARLNIARAKIPPSLEGRTQITSSSDYEGWLLSSSSTPAGTSDKNEVQNRSCNSTAVAGGLAL